MISLLMEPNPVRGVAKIILCMVLVVIFGLGATTQIFRKK